HWERGRAPCAAPPRPRRFGLPPRESLREAHTLPQNRFVPARHTRMPLWLRTVVRRWPAPAPLRASQVPPPIPHPRRHLVYLGERGALAPRVRLHSGAFAAAAYSE